METLGYILSVFIGLVLGLLGGGGSILSIPILVYVFQLSPVTASAYSLFIVGVTSLVGAIQKYKDHVVNLKTGIVFVIPSAMGSFITRKWIVPAIPEIIWENDPFVLTKRILLVGLFALLMMLASISMIKGGLKEINPKERGLNPLLLAAEGTLIGLLTGFVGAGGGFLIIPALIFLTGLNFKTAAGTSLFIIGVTSLTGFAGDLLNYFMDWKFLFSITLLAIAGILAGTFLSKKMDSKTLRKIFGWFALLTGCWILIKELLLN